MCSCTPTSSPVVSSAVGGCCLGGRYDVIHRSSPDHRETDGEQPQQRTVENLTASLLSWNTSGKKEKQKTKPPSSGFGSAESCRGGLCQPARRGGCWMRASCRGSTGRGCCWWTWLSLSLLLLPTSTTTTTPPSAVINHRGSGVASPTAAPTSSVWRWPALRLRRWHPSARAVAFSPTMRAARPLRISTLVGPLLSAPVHVTTSEAARVNLCVELIFFPQIHLQTNWFLEGFLGGKMGRVHCPAGIWVSVMALWHLSEPHLTSFFGDIFGFFPWLCCCCPAGGGEWAASIPPADARPPLLVSAVWPCDFGGCGGPDERTALEGGDVCLSSSGSNHGQWTCHPQRVWYGKSPPRPHCTLTFHSVPVFFFFSCSWRKVCNPTPAEEVNAPPETTGPLHTCSPTWALHWRFSVGKSPGDVEYYIRTGSAVSAGRLRFIHIIILQSW